MINPLVLWGWTGLFPEPKGNAQEVLSWARTISTDIYLTLELRKRKRGKNLSRKLKFVNARDI